MIRYTVSPKMMLVGDNGKEYTCYNVPYQVKIVSEVQRGWSARALIQGAWNGRTFATEAEAIAWADKANKRNEWSEGFDQFMREHRGEDGVYERYCQLAGQEPL